MYATTNTIAITACLLGALVLFNTSDSASLLITGSDDTSVPQPLDLVTQADTAADTHKKWDIAPDTEVSSAAHVTQAKEIVVFSAPWCSECKRWERCERDKFASLGYSLVYGDTKDVRFVPHFIVSDAGKTVEMSGYMTPTRLRTELLK